jgi:16S rRNA C1402 N4-methylase RsmH
MHKPVMLLETIKYLDIIAKNFYVDVTFGLGGHVNEIYKYLNDDSKITACDKDTKYFTLSTRTIKKKNNFKIFNLSFELLTLLSKCYISNIFMGMLSDLGISNDQLKNNQTGLGIKNESFLDMRLNKTQKTRATDWLNAAKKKELIEIFNIFYNKTLSNKLSKNLTNRTMR